MSRRGLVQQLAGEAGQEFNAYIREQCADSVCDAACTSCGALEFEFLEPDARNVQCDYCGQEALNSVPVLLGLI